MNYTEYNKILLNEFAIYPEAGKGTGQSLAYTVLGLVGEFGEVLHADDSPSEEELEKEMGDVLWYITRSAAEINQEDVSFLENITEQELNEILGEGTPIGAILGKIANKTKKILRDSGNEIQPEQRKYIKKYLIASAYAIESAANQLNLKPVDQLMEINVEKLRKRVKNNTIKGDGDNR